MIEKIITRNYNFSDGLLKQIADEIALFLVRDKTPFLTRGINDERVNAFKVMITTFDEAPYDEELLGDVTEATKIKDTAGENLRIAIRTVRTVVENAFGVKDGKYRVYKFERLNNTPDEILHRLARTVVTVARKQIVKYPALADEGLTDAMIDNVETIDIDFDKYIDDQAAAIGERDIKKEERIILGNAVYKEMMKLCNVGKDLFASTDPARYHDYVIYNTPNAQPPEPGTTGSMRGVVSNSQTGEPIPGVMITYPGVEEPFETDENGEYQNTMVDKNTNTFTAIHSDFNDFTGTFTIVPDQEIVYNFMMVPKTV